MDNLETSSEAGLETGPETGIMVPETSINWLGILSIVVFYLLILGVGMWAASKKGGDDLDQEVSKFLNCNFLINQPTKSVL